MSICTGSQRRCTTSSAASAPPTSPASCDARASAPPQVREPNATRRLPPLLMLGCLHRPAPRSPPAKHRPESASPPCSPTTRSTTDTQPKLPRELGGSDAHSACRSTRWSLRPRTQLGHAAHRGALPLRRCAAVAPMPERGRWPASEVMSGSSQPVGSAGGSAAGITAACRRRPCRGEVPRTTSGRTPLPGGRLPHPPSPDNSALHGTVALVAVASEQT